jgi:DNA replication initiation complex subunit (GINS family)
MPDHFTLLLEWRRNEAAGRGLAKLPPEYFGATSTYLAELRRSYEADLRENPSGRKGEISRQTYQRASQVARDILEGRVQKILALAFQASIGGGRELPNALPEGRAMFEAVLATLVAHRRSEAPYLEAAPAPFGASVPPPVAPPADAKVRAAPRSPGPKPAAPVGALAYVRIVKDSPAVEVGTDTIDLRTDDLVALPAPTAKVLIETKVAEPITPVRSPGP